MPNESTIHVVDDDAAVRDSLRWLIESAGWNVRIYSSGQAFLDAYDPATEGCLVLDVRMPGMSGPELQKQLAARSIEIPIIFITAHGSVPAAVRALHAGAVDYITKPFNNDELLNRIEQCLEKGKKLCRSRSERMKIEQRINLLTPREREVMNLVVVGKSNKAIAFELQVSIKTVEAHRAKVMEKMQAGSLAEMIRMAMTQQET